LLALEQKSVNASMNRHFIFNALNSIQYFINTQDRKSANRYLTNFAQLIRKNLDSANSNANTISLEEELDRIKLYLGLEAMRFKGCFDYEVNVGDDIDLETIKIPAMIMQPFVENSIIHGILPNEEVHGLISISVRREGNMLLLSIEDNGIGVNRSLQQKDNIDGDHRSQGMEITSKRIELIRKISKNDISLEGPEEIKDVNGSIKGTYVLIKVPLDDLDI
jgi:LytS/YehU family sensor histidine kinase